MKAAFPCTIGMAADPDHAKGGAGPWQGRIETDLPVHLSEGVVNDLGKPKGGAVEAEDDGELGEAENPNSFGTKRILQAEGVFACGQFVVLFLLEFSKNQRLFFGGKPMGAFGAIGQKKRNGQSDEDGGNSFQKKEPLPGVESVPTVGNLENPTGNGTAKNTGCSYGRHEHGGHMGSVFSREPVGEVKDDAWKKAGLGHAE